MILIFNTSSVRVQSEISNFLNQTTKKTFVLLTLQILDLKENLLDLKENDPKMNKQNALHVGHTRISNF